MIWTYIVAVVAVSSSFPLMVAAEQLNKREKRNVWVKPWILTRPVRGAYTTLFSELMKTVRPSKITRDWICQHLKTCCPR